MGRRRDRLRQVGLRGYAENVLLHGTPSSPSQHPMSLLSHLTCPRLFPKLQAFPSPSLFSSKLQPCPQSAQICSCSHQGRVGCIGQKPNANGLKPKLCSFRHRRVLYNNTGNPLSPSLDSDSLGRLYLQWGQWPPSSSGPVYPVGLLAARRTSFLMVL